MKRTFAEQVEIGPPVHLSFEHFDPIYVTFYSPGVVRQCQSRSDGIEVSAQSSRRDYGRGGWS